MYPTLFVIEMVGYNKLKVRRELGLASYIFKLVRGKLCNPGVLAEVRLNVPERYVWVAAAAAEPAGRAARSNATL